MGDVVEILGVGGDLLEQGPGFFHRREVLFLLVLATAGMHQAVLAQDALDGHVAQRQLPFALQAPGAEGGQLTTPFDHPLGQLPDDLVRRGVRGAGEFLQPLQSLRLTPPQPLAHRGDGGVKDPRRRLDALRASVGN